MTTYYTDIEHWSLVSTLICTVIGFIWAALNVPSEDIIKAVEEKRRLEKLNGAKK